VVSKSDDSWVSALLLEVVMIPFPSLFSCLCFFVPFSDDDCVALIESVGCGRFEFCRFLARRFCRASSVTRRRSSRSFRFCSRRSILWALVRGGVMVASLPSAWPLLSLAAPPLPFRFRFCVLFDFVLLSADADWRASEASQSLSLPLMGAMVMGGLDFVFVCVV